MAITFKIRNQKRHYVLYTMIVSLLLCTILLTFVGQLYTNAEGEAYETLHVQTKQIKDDVTLQMISDRENLSTMANFAAKLYKEEEEEEEERYAIMFESFKPIGLIENIGILSEDNTFVTKAGTIDVSGVLSFEEEAAKGAYFSSRVSDITTRGKEIVRSAVPIVVEDKTVAMLYGVVQLDKLYARYNQMTIDLNAQLFLYDKETGDLIVDNIHDTLGNISFLQDRQYNHGYSYEEMMATDKGFTSFRSAYKDENVHMHYSTIDELGWMIALVRYDSQVFTQTYALVQTLLIVFSAIIIVISLYILALMMSEKKVSAIADCAAEVRKTLLETADEKDNISEALKRVCTFAAARSAVFFDADSEEYHFVSPEYRKDMLGEKDRKFLKAELLRYATETHQGKGTALNVLCIKPNAHLRETNGAFYAFLKKHNIFEISFSATVAGANKTAVLATINTKRGDYSRGLAEKVSACFAIALDNKHYLNNTRMEATTDGLTGALNRVAYKNDLATLNVENVENFSCIYIDVNELHTVNNTYGHAAGDEMLLYIANTLKDVFYGHRVYRMGGDEFLVFCKNREQDVLEKGIDILFKQLANRHYRVAVGLSYRTEDINVDDMVHEAEKKMYEAKALYYQSKEQATATVEEDQDYILLKTGLPEIDTILSVLKEKYNGIYRVSLNTDKAKRILMPTYLNYNENEENFSSLFSKYVSEAVDAEYHRAVMVFLNYEAIKQQLAEGKTPKITYKKTDGETVVLSVYKLNDAETSDTLWVFAKA